MTGFVTAPAIPPDVIDVKDNTLIMAPDATPADADISAVV